MKSRAFLFLCLVCVFAFPAITVFAAGDVIPYGTELVVRVDSDIMVGSASPGDRFPATLDRDVAVRGRVVLPRGSQAEIRLRRVREGADEVSFKLETVSVGGRSYAVASEPAREATEKEGLSTGAKTLLGAAGGAALGSAIGGKKGAIIGATAGAGGGLVWAGATDRNAKISAGTPLLFRLREDLVLDR